MPESVRVADDSRLWQEPAMALNDILFPKVNLDNWQMMPSERIALTGLLSRIRPQGAIEIGIYHGGSLSLAAPFCKKIIAIDIDPAVHDRFAKPENADVWIMPSSEAIPRALAYFDSIAMPVNYILIDADHSFSGVQRDIGYVLDYIPKAPMFVVMHDSGNAETRGGMLAVDWSRNPYVHSVDLDFVPAQIIEHSVRGDKAEIWGGLAMAYLDPTRRSGPVSVQRSAYTTIRCLQYCSEERLGSIPI